MRTSAACIGIFILTVGLTAFLSAGNDAEKEPLQQKPGLVKSEVKRRSALSKPGNVAKRTKRAGIQKKSDAPRNDEPPLGKTVRLTFTISNDDGNHSFSVICAARSFLIDHNIAEADGGHEMRFSGRLKAVDQADRVFVSFDAFRSHSNNIEGHDATFKLQGSVVLKFGKKTELGQLGEEKLSLTTALVE